MKLNVKSEIMDYRDILEVIINCAQKKKKVEIYYPRTENSPEGWREIEPYSLMTDIDDQGEVLDHRKDKISPGHILKAYTVGGNDESCHFFIIGKIKKVRETKRSFTARKNWPINF